MPSIVDTHVHLADRKAFAAPAYEWHSCSEHIATAELTPEVFMQESADCQLSGVVFVECQGTKDWAQREGETKWVCDMADKGTAALCGAIVAAPIGDYAVEELKVYMDKIAHPRIVGVRNLIQGQEKGFGTTPNYIAGCKELGKRGIVVDICVKSPQLQEATELVTAAPETTFVLDHIGKPVITTDGALDASWAKDFEALAKLPNVFCKLSGMITEVEDMAWTPEIMAPYIAKTVACFGWDRVMYGSDWYASKLAGGATYPAWLKCLQADATVTGASDEEREKLFRANAAKIYKLSVHA
eukprot:TRINITY_DN22321_c0_g1_i1.p2 TRINITY_DN22321_c0_g1~~TRINITY_DN22321_c0_g1_i1.p2  ORF type:complete len:317 (+),score=117.71 TRINITY_DN22321_c0_g1_i1:57-953(+)